MLAGVYAAVFWFSPLGWWLKRKLSDLGEAISDRAGLEEAASRASYAQVLLEFAAMPRPTAAGVAMARTSNLSHRIERFLNESSFRQAFAGSRRRILLAILLVPMAVFAGTALIRVEAAASGQAVQPPTPAAAAPAQAPVAAAAPWWSCDSRDSAGADRSGHTISSRFSWVHGGTARRAANGSSFASAANRRGSGRWLGCRRGRLRFTG
jgi:hypothetical protein